MISFSCLEGIEAVIFPVTCYHPGTIISQSAAIPCTDSGYPHPFPVCLMFTTLLDISFSPQVQFLLFLFPISSPASPDTRTRSHLMVFFRISYNRTCNLLPGLYSDVSYMPIFPVSAQNHVPSGICGSVPMYGTSGLFHWDDR